MLNLGLPDFVNAKFLNAKCVNTEFGLAGFGNLDKVSCHCECQICEYWIFGIFKQGVLLPL
jgi:hypothetical protein